MLERLTYKARGLLFKLRKYTLANGLIDKTVASFISAENVCVDKFFYAFNLIFNLLWLMAL